MNTRARVLGLGQKSITKEGLAKLLGTTDNETLYLMIQPLVDEGLLVPFKNSMRSGSFSMPIYSKYRIKKPLEDTQADAREVSFLHPFLTDLAKNLDAYHKYKSLILALNTWLFERDKGSTAARFGMMSRKERSFDIFGEEKILDDKAFCALLARLGLDEGQLEYYDTPAYSFLDYIPAKKQQLTLLVLENKDPWFNLRRLLAEHSEDGMTLCGVHLDGVIYGSGNQIAKKEGLTMYTSFLGVEARYLYWGDIDRAGLNIFLSAIKNNPTLDMALFVPAYEKMLELARKKRLPDSMDEREQMADYTSLYGLFGEIHAQELKDVIALNKRIPQEIINYPILRTLVEKKDDERRDLSCL